MPVMRKDDFIASRSRKSKVKRGDGSDGESPDPVCGVPSQTTFRLDLHSLLGPPDYTIELEGKLISKKNSYSLSKNGKRMFKSRKITDAEDMIELQIPVWMRELRLVSPHIEVLTEMDSFRADRDNGYTFLQDCLVKNCVLKNDNIASCNGFIGLQPVVRSNRNRCVVNLWRNDV